MVGRAGLEPATPGLKARRSAQSLGSVREANEGRFRPAAPPVLAEGKILPPLPSGNAEGTRVSARVPSRFLS